MYRPTPAAHRIVCKSLLVCEDDGKLKIKKRPPKISLKTSTSRIVDDEIIMVKSKGSLKSTALEPSKNEVIKQSIKDTDEVHETIGSESRNPANEAEKLHHIINNLKELKMNNSENLVPGTSSISAFPNDKQSGGSCKSSLRSEEGFTKPLSVEKNLLKKCVLRKDLPFRLVEERPCAEKKYDKKETREYIRKKKLERQEKEHQELLRRKQEEETRNKKLLELRSTTLKVLKASTRKKSQPKDPKELEQKWKDLGDDQNLEVPSMALDIYSNLQVPKIPSVSKEKDYAKRKSIQRELPNVTEVVYEGPKSNASDSSIFKSYLNPSTLDYKSKVGRTDQSPVHNLKLSRNESFAEKQNFLLSNGERATFVNAQPPVQLKESRSMPNNSLTTKSDTHDFDENKIKVLEEVESKKDYILRLANEVNRLSSSIKYLKENASKTLLETNKISSKSGNPNFNNEQASKTRHVKQKHDVSKSCQNIPQEMVSAVTELKDTLTFLSSTNMKPLPLCRLSNSVECYPVPSLKSPPRAMSAGENQYDLCKNTKESSRSLKESADALKFHERYQRHRLQNKNSHHYKKYKSKNLATNESDHSLSSGFIFEMNGSSSKDSDKEDPANVQWLKMFAKKPNPLNFMTTLKSKFNLMNQLEYSQQEKLKNKCKTNEMLDSVNKKFLEDVPGSFEESVDDQSNRDGTNATPASFSALGYKPLEVANLPATVTSKYPFFSDEQHLQEGHDSPDHGLKESVVFKEKSRKCEKSPLKSGSSISKNPEIALDHSAESCIEQKEPKPVSCNRSVQCEFLPLSIAHLPSADEFKRSVKSIIKKTKRPSQEIPSETRSKPIVPALQLDDSLASLTSVSTSYSRTSDVLKSSNNHVLKAPEASLSIKPVHIQLKQITVADKSSVSSLSNSSDQTIDDQNQSQLDNKENELPKTKPNNKKCSTSDIRKVFNPNALRLQAQAELNQLDVFTESLQQLMEAERFSDLALVQKAGISMNRNQRQEKDPFSAKKIHSLKTDRKSILFSESSTLSLTEITDTSTAMSEFLSVADLQSLKSDMTKQNFNLNFSVDQSVNKHSLKMFEQLLRDEEFWANHQKESLKLREKALLNSIKTGIVWFEVQKKQLKESGQDHLIKNLKKKQRGLLLRLQQEKEEIARLQKTVIKASEERTKILKQQYQLMKMQTSKELSRPKKVDFMLSTSGIPLKSSSADLLQTQDSDFISSDRNLEMKLLKGLRALEQQKCKLSEREKQLIEHKKSVDELLQWKKKFKDIEKQAVNKRPLRDRSTSPFRMTPESNAGFVGVVAGNDADKVLNGKNINDTQENLQIGHDENPQNLDLSSEANLDVQNESLAALHYSSENVESPESPEVHQPYQLGNKIGPNVASKNLSVNAKQTSMVHIKTPLSPRLQNNRRLRYSSGSDDSLILSQNETLSEQSETEVRVSALHEQLKQRKLEAERLRREQKRAQKERLKIKEQALIKQIQAYDEYIQKTRKELEQELSQVPVPVVRPQIKQPRVAEKTVFKKQDNVPSSNTSDASDLVSTKVPVSEEKINLENSPIEVKDFLIMDHDESVSNNFKESEPLETFDEENKSKLQNQNLDDSALKSSPTTAPKIIEENQIESSTTNSLSELKIADSETTGGDQFSEILDLEKGSSVSHSTTQLSSSNRIISERLPTSNEISDNTVSTGKLHPPASEELLVSEVASSEELEQANESLKSISEASSQVTIQGSDIISDKRIDTSLIFHSKGNLSEQNYLSSAPEELESEKTSVIESASKSIVESASKSIFESVSKSAVESASKSEMKHTSESVSEATAKTSSSQTSTCNVENEVNCSEILDQVTSIKSKLDSEFVNEVEESEVSDSNPGMEKNDFNSVTILKENPPFSTIIADDLRSDKIGLNTHEDWIDADTFFEINFPSVNTKLCSNFREKVEHSHSLDKQNTSNGMEPILSEDSPHSSNLGSENYKANLLENEEFHTELKKSKIVEFDEILEDISHKIVDCEENILRLEDDDHEDDKISKCDSSSTISKTSVSSAKISESGKSYEKDRSMSEIIENYEISEIRDDYSVSSYCSKSSDDSEEMNDNDGSANTCDLFSSTFIIHGTKDNNDDNEIADQPNDLADKITDDILNMLLLDSVKCVRPIYKSMESNIKFPSQDISNASETPFLEALKRDHEAFKISSTPDFAPQPDRKTEKVASPKNDKLHNVIDIAETLLNQCLSDATDTMLNICTKKISTDLDKLEAETSTNGRLFQQRDAPTSPKNVSPSRLANEIVSCAGTENVFKEATVGEEKEAENVFTQEWLVDEECAQREAEKLRQKQLQIEREIERLQQAPELTPYIYERFLREIPNKPPPPYTPPVQPENVPTDEETVLSIVETAVSHIFDLRLSNAEPAPPPGFVPEKNNPIAIYKKFLFDLSLQLINEIYEDDFNEAALPWEQAIKRKPKTKVPSSKTDLVNEIKHKVSILFGYRKKVAKENLIIRWSRKKRDHVDELLVRESQEEEQEWTNYELDEITVKNQITTSLLNSLLNNTAMALSIALKNKIEKSDK